MLGRVDQGADGVLEGERGLGVRQRLEHPPTIRQVDDLADDGFHDSIATGGSARFSGVQIPKISCGLSPFRVDRITRTEVVSDGNSSRNLRTPISGIVFL